MSLSLKTELFIFMSVPALKTFHLLTVFTLCARDLIYIVVFLGLSVTHPPAQEFYLHPFLHT